MSNKRFEADGQNRYALLQNWVAELGQSHLIAPNRGKIKFGQDLLVVGFAAREAQPESGSERLPLSASGCDRCVRAAADVL